MNATKSTLARTSDWLTDSGEMGTLMREMDWAQTPLGPSELWSPSLKMMVRFLLVNRFPLLLWWGPDFCQLYNDAYRPILGTKHPHFLGRPVSECWNEIWHILRPLIETPFNGGPATWMDDIMLEINRYGFTEESHFTIAYSPVPDETVASGIGGVLATVHEITEKVIGERRIVVLRDLSTRAGEAKSAEQACAIAALTLGRHATDVPFALLYLLDEDGKQARLAGSAGIKAGGVATPALIDLSDPASDRLWPLSAAVQSDCMQIVDDLARCLDGDVPVGPWSDPPSQAVVLPIRSSTPQHPAGVLIVGVSARLRLDDSYRNFLELAAGQIATAVANARAYEEERKRAEALAEVDRAKTAFFSNISHEFRTPLTLMLGPLEDALADDGLSPAAHDRLEVAHRNSRRLLKLVNNLLDFSRVEAGRIEAVFEPTDLASMTRDLTSVFRSTIERAGMRLVVDCDSFSEPIYVDREMWEKIVLNLLSNAFKFTFQGEIKVDLKKSGDHAEFSVSDTGTGILSKDLPRLFERFYRGSVARGRSYEGSGIGLALVQELVKRHGGSVSATSEIGRGSVFRVRIPLGREHLPADRIGASRTLASTGLAAQNIVDEISRWLPESVNGARATAGAALSPVPPSSSESVSRILLADDNADMREYLRRILAHDYEVVAVSDGEAALQTLKETPYALVLTDVMMPRLDGFALLKALRSDPQMRTLPVILLSARAGEESRLEGLNAGADDYLVKPFSARELLARVESTLKLSKLRRQEEERTLADLQAIERLNKLGDLCASSHDYQECLRETLATGVFLTGADMGNIQLVDQESGALRIVEHAGLSESFLRFFERVDHDQASTCRVALKAGRRVVVEDVLTSDIFAGQSSLEVMKDSGIRAIQSTPLISKSGQVLGMISTHFREPHHPGERELRLMDLLARQTADDLERKLAEGALRAHKAQLQALFDNVPLGVYLVDADFRIRQVNPTAVALFGDIPNLIGRDFDAVVHSLWPEDYADELVKLFRRTLETGESYFTPGEIEKRRDRGLTEYYEWQINRIPLPEGNHGVVCYFKDVSARKFAEREKERAQARNKFLVRLDDAIRPLDDPHEITLTAARILGEQLGVDRCAYADVEQDEDHMHLAGNYLRSPEIRSIVGKLRFADFGAEVLQAMRTDKPYVVNDVDTHLPSVGDLAAYRRTQIQAVICVPLHKSGKLVAAMAVHTKSPRVWTSDEVELVQLVAARCWESIERARVARELKESEARYRAFVTASSDVVYRMSADWSEMRQLEGREFVADTQPNGEWLQKYIHPDDQQLVMATIHHALEKRTKFELEHRVVRSDGSLGWTFSRAIPIPGPDGEVVEWLGTASDVTRRKEAEAALRNSEGKYRTVLSSMDEGLMIAQVLFDESGKVPIDYLVLETNEAFYEHTGLPQNIVGKTIREIVVGDEVPWLGIYGEVALTGEQTRFEYEITVEPLVGWYDVFIQRIGEPDQHRVAVMFQDITERKRVEESVAKQNERLNLLWEAAGVLLTTDEPDAMLSSLFDKIRKSLQLDVYFNFMVTESGDALRLVSYAGISDETAGSMTRLDFGQAVCGRVAMRHQPIVATYIQDSNEEMVQLVKSFGIRAYACNPLLAGGRLLGTLSFASRNREYFDQDEIEFIETISKYVTAAYERLGLIDQLRDQDRRKDEFLATLAHELRNPLAPMHNGLQLLRLAGNNSATLEQARAMMERQLQQMKRLVDDLLDVSRISRNKLDLKMERVELATVVGSAIETSRPLLESAGQKLSVSLPPDPVFLDADPVRLAQAFSNLLNNAAKYSERGGQVWFQVDQLPDEVVVRVRDTGIGIPADKLPTIFDIFVQVDHSLERSQGGLGVGLTLVKQLVQMHHGSIEVRSDGPGQGSEFIVHLPSSQSCQQGTDSKKENVDAPHANGSRRILVVDDNRDSAESLTIMLELLGHKVWSAHDGLEAIEAAKEFRPEVAFLDLGMPRMNGYDAARIIRQQPECQGVTLVALTGWGQEEDKRRSQEAGFDVHLVKPIDFDALEKLLGREQ